MKKFYLFAAAAVLLAACVKTQTLDEVTPIGADETAVSFDVYTPRATKAGKPLEITTEKLKEGPGFGVFAYFTNNGTYDQYVKPNFMYNQQVTWKNSKWTYEPVKYWPNETGNAAKSDDKDYVTFFAYAPYVLTDPATGAVKRPADAPDHVPSETELQQKNITGMINNNTMGDPKIKYVVDLNPATSVDLLWGVQSGDANNDKGGLPFLNQLKPKKADTTTTFSMRHALAKLNVQIRAIGDEQLQAYGGGAIDGNTKIYVRSITFEGFATKGTLNLNNPQANTPLWMDYAGIDNLVAEPVTIYDGRKDGKEGYQDGDASSEKVTGLNHDIIQCKETTPGVTYDYVNLFSPIDPNATTVSAADPIYVIPNGDPMRVTIVYDVETVDNKLASYLSDGKTHGSTIENKITRPIQLDNANIIMSAGKAYTISLHLCMTTVKVEAEVENWVVEVEDTTVRLPASNS